MTDKEVEIVAELTARKQSDMTIEAMKNILADKLVIHSSQCPGAKVTDAIADHARDCSAAKIKAINVGIISVIATAATILFGHAADAIKNLILGK